MKSGILIVMNVHLIDGTYELFRSYFGAPSRTNSDGLEIGATLGFARSMAMLLRQPEVTHVGIAFDTEVKSFRNDLFDGYKTGDGIEPDLFAQFPWVEKIASALGMKVWPMIEFEADDAIATAAKTAALDSRVERVVIASPDKDLCQCVRGQKVIVWDRRRDIELDEQAVEEKFGVPPASIPDYLALVGDTADGLPGIAKWGAKSTSKVLGYYKKLEKIPTDVLAWNIKVRGASGLSNALNQATEEALLYRKLATLVDSVPLLGEVQDWAWQGVDTSLLQTIAKELQEPQIANLRTTA